ncbi:MAG TPA: DNA recombination protein RmuC [Actinocrinis sp.]|nr:DNA recombination protein RmuC [Actinocrinis sp.]
MNSSELALLLVGLVLGTILGILWERGRNRSSSGEALDRSTTALLSLAENQFAQVGRPIQESLQHLDERMREIEQGRVATQATLTQQIEDVRVSGEQLRTQTAALVTALRAPQVRGRWGELHLRRAVELAGLVNRVDFSEQVVIGVGPDGDEKVARPDLVVHLAGDKNIVIDAKVPLGAFLEAAEAQDELIRAERLRAHAKQLRAHVDELSSRAYWRRLAASGSPTPEFVVLFVPGDAFLAHALESDANLLDYAAQRNVVLASPSTLIALLRTVAHAWSQESLASEARTIIDLGRELFDRIGVLTEHLDKVGSSLGNAVSAYNKAIGSLDSRVLVTARRLHDLGVSDTLPTSPRQLDTATRSSSQMDADPSADVAGREAKQADAGRAEPERGGDVPSADSPSADSVRGEPVGDVRDARSGPAPLPGAATRAADSMQPGRSVPERKQSGLMQPPSRQPLPPLPRPAGDDRITPR